MKQQNYKDGILYFSENMRDYKTDYDLNIERIDGESCLGDFSKKDKFRIAQQITLCKAIEEGIITDYTLEGLINKNF